MSNETPKELGVFILNSMLEKPMFYMFEQKGLGYFTGCKPYLEKCSMIDLFWGQYDQGMILEFPNKMCISIRWNLGAYCDMYRLIGPDEKFSRYSTTAETAMWYLENPESLYWLHYEDLTFTHLGVTSDVYGYQSPALVCEMCEKISNFKIAMGVDRNGFKLPYVINDTPLLLPDGK